VKVAAPGGNTGQSTTGTGQPDGVFSTMASFNTAGNRVSTLGFLQGTSMASPHVAGVMALMRYINPALTPAQVDGLLGNLVDDLGSAGWDSRYGHGLINADKAVRAALTSVGATPPTPAGQVVAEPSSLDFGSFQTSGQLRLAYSGSSSERVTAVTSSNTAALSVTAASVDANGLGSYNLTVNRGALPTGTSYLSLTVAVGSGGRSSFQIPVVVAKGAGGFSRARGFGPIYVLLQDPDDESYTRSTIATFSDLVGAYRWSYSGYARSKVVVIAGTDLDNDGYICQRGEACGGYPVLEAVIDGQGVALSGHRSDLNFQAAPLSGISAQATNGQGGARGFRRASTQP
jgi:serine protease